MRSTSSRRRNHPDMHASFDTARAMERLEAFQRVKQTETDRWEQKVAHVYEECDATIGTYTLTRHAFARMLQHRIRADDVLQALNAPEHINRPIGKQPQMIGRKCSVIANGKTIITVIPS